MEWLYGAATNLHVVGAPTGTEPILSQAGVRQGCPLSMLLFALVLQPVLKRVNSAAGAGFTLVSVADDITMVGREGQLLAAWQNLTGAQGASKANLQLQPPKCFLHGGDATRAAALAPRLRIGEQHVQHAPEGIVVAGTPVGTDAFVARTVEERADEVVKEVDRLMELPLGRQVQFGLLRVSLSRRLLHYQRCVPWAQLQEGALRVERAICKAATAIFRLAAPPEAGLPSPDYAQQQELLRLPTRHGGFGLAGGLLPGHLRNKRQAWLMANHVPEERQQPMLQGACRLTATAEAHKWLYCASALSSELSTRILQHHPAAMLKGPAYRARSALKRRVIHKRLPAHQRHAELLVDATHKRSPGHAAALSYLAQLGHEAARRLAMQAVRLCGEGPEVVAAALHNVRQRVALATLRRRRRCAGRVRCGVYVRRGLRMRHDNVSDDEGAARHDGDDVATPRALVAGQRRVRCARACVVRLRGDCAACAANAMAPGRSLDVMAQIAFARAVAADHRVVRARGVAAGAGAGEGLH